MPLAILGMDFSIAAALGIVVGAIFLMPAVTALVGELLRRRHRARGGAQHYPGEPAGTPVPLARALFEGVKTALLAVLRLSAGAAVPAGGGLGVVIFFLATAFLLGREYFELAAMRHHPVAEAKRLRKEHHGTVFIAGLFIAAFVSIPIVNLATPLFGTAMMVTCLQANSDVTASDVTATRTVPSASAITRSVLASNSMPTSRSAVTAASTRTPSALLRKSAIAASMLLRALMRERVQVDGRALGQRGFEIRDRGARRGAEQTEGRLRFDVERDVGEPQHLARRDRAPACPRHARSPRRRDRTSSSARWP